MSIADLLQMAGSSLQLLLAAVPLSLASTLFVRWLDRRSARREQERIDRQQQEERERAGSEAARIAEIQDAADFRRQLMAYVEQLEQGRAREQQAFQKAYAQLTADRDAERAGLLSAHAQDIATRESQHAEHLALVRAEHAQCEERVARMTEDNITLWNRLNEYADAQTAASRLLAAPTGETP